MVSKRLSIPFTRTEKEQREAVREEREYWTIGYLIDRLSERLASTKESITCEGRNVTIYKYYNQALRLWKWISIAKPTHEFIIYASDLPIRMLLELRVLDKATYKYVIKQSVGRIFKLIDERYYRKHIERHLEVRLDK